MRDNEWLLKYGSTSLTFGPGDLPVFNLTTPDLGDAEIEVADQRKPRTDGRNFGVDFRGGRTIPFDLGIRATTPAAVRAEAARVQAAWRADAVRLTPGAVASLTFRYDGRERAVYGRPRRFAANYADVAANRLVTIQADFACVDDLFYAPALSAPVVIPLVPAPIGGLVAPLASPLVTTASSDRSMGLTVGGEMNAWPVITIKGPMTNPVFEVVGRWKVALNLTLAYDETLVIDTRPWVRTIKRNGASVAGSITGTSPRLSAMGIPPGDHEVVLRGTSDSGTPTASVRVLESYPAP